MGSGDGDAGSSGSGPEPEPTGGASGRRRGGPVARFVYGLLVRCHRLAESGWGGAAIGGWAVLQGSVVPGPSDALLIPLGISDPGRVFRLASWAVLGATVGGVIAYLIGALAFVEVGRPLLEFVGVSPERLEGSRAVFERHGWQLVALSAISPLPTKAVCIAAGAFDMPIWLFISAILTGRGMRFYGLAAVIRLASPRLLNWLTSRVSGVRGRG